MDRTHHVRSEPDNENNSFPVYRKITKKFTQIIERKIYPIRKYIVCRGLHARTDAYNAHVQMPSHHS